MVFVCQRTLSYCSPNVSILYGIDDKLCKLNMLLDYNNSMANSWYLRLTLNMKEILTFCEMLLTSKVTIHTKNEKIKHKNKEV
ncbi:hypothetical protein KUTeg_022837 [Tegillarca granosa]|uniref:Uncharacterized protein n=1 Tax=Tegillarca granosa TaxID=220873 RepID=A0ABQ9E0K0_TEGGR|nr:hypothetical protein KUTeg_022837 [Tegillarca granosa]